MSQFKKRVQAKMSASKALCLMGFGVTITVDQALGEDPKEALNKAIFGQMQALMLKKTEPIEEKTANKSSSSSTPAARGAKKPPNKKDVKSNDQSTHDNSYLTSYSSQRPGQKGVTPCQAELDENAREKKYAEDVMNLHEAYQFLMRRHINAEKGREKLSHAVKTIHKLNMLFGKVNNEEEANDSKTFPGPVNEEITNQVADELDESEVELEQENIVGDVIEIPCEACIMIEKLEDFAEDDKQIENTSSLTTEVTDAETEINTEVAEIETEKNTEVTEVENEINIATEQEVVEKNESNGLDEKLSNGLDEKESKGLDEKEIRAGNTTKERKEIQTEIVVEKKKVGEKEKKEKKKDPKKVGRVKKQKGSSDEKKVGKQERKKDVAERKI